MLHRSISRNQFLVFSTYSLLLIFLLSISTIQQTQAPTVYADEYFAPRPHIKNTKILIFGDMMLDRHIREKINDEHPMFPFEQITELISGNDIVVANAEGSFSFYDSKTVGKKNGPLEFTFDPMLLPVLKNLGFTLLGQANNHSFNFGEKGLNQSTTSIVIAGMNYFGDPSNKDIAPYITEINGEKIGFVAYNEFSYKNKDKVIKAIQETKEQVGYLIVYPHWGQEYNPNFTKSQQKTAHEFIDAGADVIIGTHPHVIEPIEFYKDKPIFYSVGNFIFDQALQGPTTEGLAIKILLNSKSIKYEIHPFFIENAQVSLMDEISKRSIFTTLEKTVVNPTNLKIDFDKGIIELLK